MAGLFILAAVWLMIGSVCHGQLSEQNVTDPENQTGMLGPKLTL